MRDNKEAARFEREENGLLVWADYRARDAKLIIPHVEAEPRLRGTGAAGRLMQDIVDDARKRGLTLEPRCSYARAWFQRHPDAQDVI